MPSLEVQIKEAREKLAGATTDRLVEILGNPHQHLSRRLVALEMLLCLGEPLAIEAINRTIIREDRHAQLGPAAIRGVSEMKRREAIDALAVALNTRSKYVRCLAAAALSEIGDKRAIEPLISALNSKSQHMDVRCGAVTALGVLGGTRASDVLIATLNDKSAEEKLRQTAAFSLAEPLTVSRRSIEALRRAATFTDQTHYVRASAVLALERLANLYLVYRELGTILAPPEQ